ncbi:unnamed protein product [Rotaria sordida]|uniref:Uncharacterized protein n=1 Tax=Rotaria sordida TaxID=392033 RepID=A0A819WAB3_9BILA|nr:unnamed protein product [Rotaria sordida]
MNSTDFSSSETNTSSSSSSLSKIKSHKPNKHYCLVRNIENNKVTVLVITSFNGKDPTNITNDVVVPMLSRNFLLNRLIAINKTKPIRGKKCIRSKPTSNASVMLYGYLILIETFAANDTVWPEPISEVFCSSDMHYIDFRLRKLANEEKLTSSCNNDINASTKSSESIPIGRTLMNEEYDLRKLYTEEWLKQNRFSYDDEMMDETNVSLSSSKINIFQEANEDCLSHINIFSTVDHEIYVFNDVCGEQLPFIDNDNQTMWFLFNETGKDLIIDYLNDLEFDGNISSTSINLKQNESIRLFVECQLSVKIGDIVKTINLNRTCKRVYDLSVSTDQNRPIQMLCDIQIRNDCRHVIFRSLVKIYNNTTMPLSIINFDSVGTIQNQKIATIEVNDQYFVPIDLLYKYSSSSIYIGAHEGGTNTEINNCCSIDWENQSTMERTLKLKNGIEAHLTIITELNDAYIENTDQLDRACFDLYITTTEPPTSKKISCSIIVI